MEFFFFAMDFWHLTIYVFVTNGVLGQGLLQVYEDFHNNGYKIMIIGSVSKVPRLMTSSTSQKSMRDLATFFRYLARDARFYSLQIYFVSFR